MEPVHTQVSNEDATRLRRRTWITRTSILAVLILTGYASSFVSTTRCELAAAHELAREVETRNVFVLPPDANTPEGPYSASAEILSQAGFTVRTCETSSADFNCFPWAGVAKAAVKYPFLVDVRWGYVAAPLIGAGARSRYVAFFGIVFHITDLGAWGA